VICDQSPRFSNRDSGNHHRIKSPIEFNRNLHPDHDQHPQARGIQRNNNPSNLHFPVVRLLGFGVEKHDDAVDALVYLILGLVSDGIARRTSTTFSWGVPDMRIGRYIDLPKLVSMLSSRSLYFACTNEFNDPYEGYLPRSHVQAHIEIAQKYIAQIRGNRDRLVEMFPDRDHAVLDTAVQQAEAGLHAPALLKSVATRFGVNCWRKNEIESAAMWQLYGNCVAVESSMPRLQSAFSRDGMIFDEVRYMDFDADPIEKGHQHYSLFIKRKAFQHEQEVRATILLKQFGKGELVECDIEKLVTAIHVAPLAAPYYVDAVRQVVERIRASTTIPVVPSSLLTPPDY
jgi:hypothetical protein